jgi:protein-S-isoprenylcysteine O-methyltransferase Ste14
VSNDAQDNAGVIAPPPLIYFGSLILVLLLNRKFSAPFLPRGVALIFGGTLLSGGVLLVGWFVRTMRSAGTPLSPREPVSKLITTGPFRYTRNPGYLGLAMIYSGIAFLANTLWVILLLPATLLVIQRGVIEREERYLERKFGEEYLRYKAQVRRWI